MFSLDLRVVPRSEIAPIEGRPGPSILWMHMVFHLRCQQHRGACLKTPPPNTPSYGDWRHFYIGMERSSRTHSKVRCQWMFAKRLLHSKTIHYPHCKEGVRLMPIPSHSPLLQRTSHHSVSPRQAGPVAGACAHHTGHRVVRRRGLPQPPRNRRSAGPPRIPLSCSPQIIPVAAMVLPCNKSSEL